MRTNHWAYFLVQAISQYRRELHKHIANCITPHTNIYKKLYLKHMSG